MKKIITLFLVTTICCTMFAGCSARKIEKVKTDENFDLDISLTEDELAKKEEIDTGMKQWEKKGFVKFCDKPVSLPMTYGELLEITEEELNTDKKLQPKEYLEVPTHATAKTIITLYNPTEKELSLKDCIVTRITSSGGDSYYSNNLTAGEIYVSGAFLEKEELFELMGGEPNGTIEMFNTYSYSWFSEQSQYYQINISLIWDEIMYVVSSVELHFDAQNYYDSLEFPF